MNLNTLLPQLTDNLVRDLAWAIGSPSLIDPRFPGFQGKVVNDAYCDEQLEKATDWLKELDKSPASLHEFIHRHKSSRLGRYFERLIEFWLEHRQDVEDLRAGEPVRRGAHNTLGEFDFIFKENGQWRHWETVVKFYLQDPHGEGWHDYVGPGAKDRLAIKINRVFERQLALSKTPEGQQVLGDRQPVSPFTYFKGYLFSHAEGSSIVPGFSAPGVSPHHLHGWWCRANNPLPSIRKDSRWCVLPRLRWLSPCLIDRNSRHHHYSHEEMTAFIEEQFSSLTEPILVAELGALPNDDLLEISRGFVVNSGWPEQGAK